MPAKRASASIPGLLRTAMEVTALVGEDSCVLIGALAVAVHGRPRATKDVDFIARTSLRDVAAILEEHGLVVEWRRGDPFEGVPTLLRVVVQGVTVDILPELIPIDWSRRVRVPYRGGVLSVVEVSDLLRLKLRAGGILDLIDCAHVLWRHPDLVPFARELAGRYGVQDKLDLCLADERERLKAQAGTGPLSRAAPATSAGVRPSRAGSAGRRGARRGGRAARRRPATR